MNFSRDVEKEKEREKKENKKKKYKSYRLEKKTYTVPRHTQHDCRQWIHRRTTRANKSSKVAGYKVNIQKNNCISIPSNEQLKSEIKK